MPKAKESLSELLKRVVKKYPMQFRSDKEVLFCLICDKRVSVKQIFQVEQHLATQLHKDAIGRKSGGVESVSQSLLTTLNETVDHNWDASEFALDLAKCFLEPNIPLHKISHPSVANFFPLAAEKTKRDFYVDDFISGTDTATEVQLLYHEMTEMMYNCGFDLAKWTTKSSQVHDMLRNEDADKVVALDFKDNETENSMLKLSWLPTLDTFKYNIKVLKADEKIEKRKIISRAARLYDPNDYLAPVTLSAKIIEDYGKQTAARTPD